MIFVMIFFVMRSVADGGAEVRRLRVASCQCYCILNVFSVEPLAHVITVLNNSFCTILVQSWYNIK